MDFFTGLSVFNEILGLPKAERKTIRAAVKQAEEQASQGASWGQLEPTFRRVMGYVG